MQCTCHFGVLDTERQFSKQAGSSRFVVINFILEEEIWTFRLMAIDSSSSARLGAYWVGILESEEISVSSILRFIFLP